MIRVNVTEFRNHLPTYLGKVKTGEEVAVTVRGKVIARLVPEVDECSAARQRLEAIRKASWVGDVVSPTGEAWEAGGGA
ncbi:MAG: prevent-host-death protein [Deltaproteobacteria bacterium RIFOXYD12_FULL_57_12]|nr:MAG: prevent-host-death protein [Deltaproteobacteria bacterium RIFOXYD12_FULL_57_12]